MPSRKPLDFSERHAKVVKGLYVKPLQMNKPTKVSRARLDEAVVAYFAAYTASTSVPTGGDSSGAGYDAEAGLEVLHEAGRAVDGCTQQQLRALGLKHWIRVPKLRLLKREVKARGKKVVQTYRSAAPPSNKDCAESLGVTVPQFRRILATAEAVVRQNLRKAA
ncbi:MAG: hypothetical protein V3W44_09770 [Dehalococcoidales bacterium]